MTHRKEKPLVCSRGCVANTSLAGAREGRERRAQHITKSHTMGNCLSGWCAQWEELHSSSAFPQVWSLKNSTKVNICSCGSSATSLELIHFLTFSQLLACNGISSLEARLDFKEKVPEVTSSSLIHCSALVLEEVLQTHNLKLFRATK